MISGTYTLNVNWTGILYEATILEIGRSATGATVKEAVKNVKNVLIGVLRNEVEKQEQIDILENSARTKVQEVEGLAELEALKDEMEDAFYRVTMYAEVEIKVNAPAPKYAIEDAIYALNAAMDNLHEKVDDVDEAEVVANKAVLITHA